MTIHSEDLREKVALAIKANRFVRTGRESSIEQMDAPTENELDDARVAVETILSLLSSIKEGDAAKLKQAERALEWAAAFAEVRARDDSKTFAKVSRGAITTIAELARQALSSIRETESVADA